MANHPDAYLDEPVAMLWAGQVWTIPAFTQAIHPSNPGPLPRDERGEVALSQAVRLLPTPCRPVGHDGATVARFPGVPAGHMSTAPGSCPGAA